jgi:hypothetical protein
MPSYRIYELKPDGQFTGPPCDVVCSDDKMAVHIAQGMMPEGVVPEIWLGRRRLEHDPTPLIDRAGLWRADQAERCDGHVNLSRPRAR